MEKKKLKLTISGSSKKTINNIEIAKAHGKNSVVKEKKNNRFGSKSSFSKNNQHRPVLSGFAPPHVSKGSAVGFT